MGHARAQISPAHPFQNRLVRLLALTLGKFLPVPARTLDVKLRLLLDSMV